MEVYIGNKFVKEGNSSYIDKERVEYVDYYMKDKCDLSFIGGMCLDLGIDYRSDKLFWKLPSVRDDKCLQVIITDEDANKIGEIVHVTSTRLVKMFVASKEYKDDN